MQTTQYRLNSSFPSIDLVLLKIYFQADLRDPNLEELTVELEDMDAPYFNREHPRNAAKRRRITVLEKSFVTIADSCPSLFIAGCLHWFLQPILYWRRVSSQSSIVALRCSSQIHFQADLRDPDLEELMVALEDMDAPDFNREHPRNTAKHRRITVLEKSFVTIADSCPSLFIAGCLHWLPPLVSPAILVLELMVVVDLSDLELLELLSEKLACVPTPILEVPFAFEYSPELLPY
nr:hypothetical protein Iba_chr13aCG10850 [Ipomoea batatas]